MNKNHHFLFVNYINFQKGGGMKQVIAAIIIAFLLVCNCYAVDGNINVTLGMNFMDNDDWKPLDEQKEIGVNIDLCGNAPIALTLGYCRSSDGENIDGLDIDTSASEIRVGIKKIWEVDDNVNLFLGGGYTHIAVDADISNGEQYLSVNDDDSAHGGWIGCGAYMTINETVNLGVQVEYSRADVELFGVGADAGGTHVALIVGYHF